MTVGPFLAVLVAKCPGNGCGGPGGGFEQVEVAASHDCDRC